MNLISEVKQISSALILASKEAAASYLVDASYRLREVRYYVANNLYFFISRIPSEKTRYLFLCYVKFNNLSSIEIVLTSKINLLLKLHLVFNIFLRVSMCVRRRPRPWGPFLESPENFSSPKLRPAYCVKLVFSYFVKGIKIIELFIGEEQSQFGEKQPSVRQY